MDDVLMYSRQDNLTHSGYTSAEPLPDVRPRRSIAETFSELRQSPEPIYRCMAPAPDGFVRRGELDRLNDLLQAGAADNSLTALVGPEGFGKTTLAQAICWDLQIRTRFPDGILWASLGETLDAHGRLTRFRDLVRWWTRTEPPVFATAAAAGAHLCTLLAGRRVLLVIDGSASPADLTPFAGLPAGSALLVTTRNREALPPDVQPLAIGPMAAPEAVTLLRAGLPPGAEGRFQALARRLGHWPLLLGILNRQLRERAGHGRPALDEALQDVVRALEIVGFGEIDREDPDSRRAAVWRAVVVALRSLSSQERDRLLDLAALPAEEDLPLAVVRDLWGLGPAEARKLCKRLRDLSLLQFDPWAGTLRFHSVIGSFLKGRRRDELPALHGRLLDVRRPESGRWADLPEEETYLWRHLARHLLAAGRGGELRETLLDLAFLRAKLEATDVHALLADFDLAAGGDRALSLVSEALHQSASALGNDRAELAPQLLDRLRDRRERGLEPLLDALRRDRETTARTEEPMAVHGFLAVSAAGPALRVWDLETRETLHTLEGHTADVTAVVLMGGRRVLSGARDKTLRLWDLCTGRTVRTFEGHTDQVSAVAVVDEHRVLSGAGDGTLRLWDLETGETLQVLEGHGHTVAALGLASSNLAVSSSLDGTLRVWDLDRGQNVAVFPLDLPVGALTANLLKLVEPE